MASPNGYFDCAASSNITRNWYRARITHDTTSPPWDTPNAGSYEFEINVGTTALGPFTPAAITAPGNECTTEPDNLFSPNGVADSVFGVGGPAVLLADTDYWLEIILRDPTDVEVDRFVCGPTHTEAYPAFNCQGPVVTQTTGEITLATTTGSLNLTAPCNQDSVVWELATVSGGPYTAAPSEPVETLSLTHTFTGLTPGTQYFARARLTEQAQTAGEYLVTAECPFITTAAPEPGGQSMFQPQPCNTGGSGEAGADVEQTLLCDVLPDGSIAGTALAVYEYDSDGNPVGAPTFINPATGAAYVAQGTLQPCRQGCCPEPVVLCDVQPDNSTIQFLRSYTGDEAGNIDATDTLLDGTPYAPTGVVSDCDPYRLCTPSSDQDLNGDCGPGETPNTVLIGGEGDSSDSVIHDDPTADPLCGGVWDRPSEASPFTVLETFRNATFDQPGPVTQGSAPYAGLTASPGWTGSNVDAPGQGWLQTSDINSFTNGIWQVPAPFSTADGMTAQVTFASHDGTITPNGDGMAFVFTDGSIPPQSSAIGGGGGLGLPNWQGGYVAVVMDEYGGVCGANSICLSGAGSAAVPPGTALGAFASMSVAPHNISADTGRANPGRLITSIISEGGQTYVSASILWDGDAEPTVYFDRFNVTAAGLPPAPATLRMSLYGGSGGAFRSEHEYRDATATAAGSQQWRAFPIITDPVPPCVTSVRVEACVDVTFTEDTQTTGNGNPEAFLWLVNTATNTVLDKAQRSSQPSQVGTANNLCVDATVPIAQLANLRVYVGAETRDNNGIYGSSWENLEITVAGLGCPVQPVRTLAISAPCPIDVNIIGGTADGTPAPVTVVNTPSTFEDALVCITSGGDTFSGFRREVRAADGTVTVSFLSTDGIPVVPDTWTAGQCAAGDTELLEVCDLGTDPPTPFVRRVTYDGNGLVVSSEDVDYTGVPYVPVGLAGRCDACAPLVLDQVCVTSTDFPGLTLPAVAVRTCDGTMEFLNPNTGIPWPNSSGPVICPPDNTPWEEILCDDGNGNEPFRRIYTLTPLGSVIAADEDLNGAPYVVVGDAVLCVSDSPGRDVEQAILCDDNGPFVRVYQYNDQSGLPSGVPNDYTLAGGPYVTVGTVGQCCTNSSTLLVCDLPTGDPDGTPTVTDSGQQFIPDTANADFIQRPGGGGALWTGGVINFGPDVSTNPGVITQVHRYVSATLQAVPPSCTDGTVHVSMSVQVLNQGPGAGCSGAGRFRLYRVSDGAVLASGTPLFGTPVGASVSLTIEADIAAAELTSGNVAVWLDVETFQTATCPPPDGKTWQASNFTAAYAYGQEGCETQFLRTVVTDCETGVTLATVDTTVDGAPYVVTGDAGECTAAASSGSTCPCVTAESIGQAVAAEATDTEVLQLCDSVGGVPFLRRLTFDATGALTATVDTDLDGAPYAVVGDAIDCGAEARRDVEQVILCDNNGPFIRAFQYGDDTGTPTGAPANYTLAGAAYVPVGPVVNCGASTTARDEELLVLCDTTPTRFLRRYNYDAATGALIGIVNTTLDGATPFVPVGAVGVCTTAIASDFDFLSTVLCDSNGTQFIQRLTFNSSTGAVTATTNTTLTGGAFVPVGAVSLCSNCCPQVIGEGCTNTGSGFYTAIRSTAGAISLIDSVTGAAILAANIIPCPGDDTVRTLTAQARLVGDADTPWTPGADVVGTLTSVTMTVLSGTATLTDQSGTVLAGLPAGFTASWSVEDDNTLGGPTSIDAIGGSTVVHWTQR